MREKVKHFHFQAKECVFICERMTARVIQKRMGRERKKREKRGERKREKKKKKQKEVKG